ncbi:hypothetical protein ACJJTC_012832 [Scirpophaga incertulas]
MGRKHSRHAHRNKRSRRRLEYSSDESSYNTDDSNHVSRRKTTKHSRQQHVHTSQHNKTSSNTSECGRRNTRGDRRSNGVGSRNAATLRDCCTPILAMEEQRPTPQISTPVPVARHVFGQCVWAPRGVPHSVAAAARPASLITSGHWNPPS